MKCKRKTTVSYSISSILRSNEGTSLVFVTIIAIIIITSVVILRMAVGPLWASADKQIYQDQAYEMATSMGETVDTLILSRKIRLDGYSSYPHRIVTHSPAALANATVTVTVSRSTIDAKTFVVTVVAEVSNTEYTYTATYTGAGTSYTRMY
ncbi:MAG: hypothetical protein J6O00_06005 [Clostridiales bacterium]|nr:hypothetical protein [Clostridiales bacterium]